jgi:hypothetical protein
MGKINNKEKVIAQDLDDEPPVAVPRDGVNRSARIFE